MSKHKAAGKTRQHVRPDGKRRGVKVSGGQRVQPGSILVRQVGTAYNAGKGTRLGRDYSVYAVVVGVVKFSQKLGKRIVSVVS